MKIQLKRTSENLNNSEIIDKVAIVGRLFTENKGIDSIIKYVNQNKKIKWGLIKKY